jgi:predicted RNase H-like HicB family nuclease
MALERLPAKPLTLEIVLEPEDGGWHVSVPAVEGCHAWGPNLSQARRKIREALACCPGQFGSAEKADQAVAAAVFEEQVKLPPALKRALNQCQLAQASLVRARRDSAEGARELVESLGLRDTGELLGLSQEGVRALLKAE